MHNWQIANADTNAIAIAIEITTKIVIVRMRNVIGNRDYKRDSNCNSIRDCNCDCSDDCKCKCNSGCNEQILYRNPTTFEGPPLCTCIAQTFGLLQNCAILLLECCLALHFFVARLQSIPTKLGQRRRRLFGKIDHKLPPRPIKMHSHWAHFNGFWWKRLTKGAWRRPLSLRSYFKNSIFEMLICCNIFILGILQAMLATLFLERFLFRAKIPDLGRCTWV